jgi:Transposase DDE domain
VQVVRYEQRRVVVLKHLGSGHSEDEVAALVDAARQWVASTTAQQDLFGPSRRRTLALATTRYLGATHALCYQVLRGAAARCGLDPLDDELLLDLAIMRLVEPGSKLRAIRQMKEYFGRQHAERTVYRAMRGMATHKDPLERIAMAYARERLHASLNMVLYDVTTLYFESFDADELRKPGFSKDGKPQQPQIVLGLLVTTEGFPLGYEVFAGNTFEGKTMLPVLRAFMARHAVRDMVVVADAAMLSQAVLEELRKEQVDYIVGARMANAPPQLIKRVSAQLDAQDKAIIRVPSKHGDMVCQFSAKRYKKDHAILQQQLAKAQALVARGEPGKRAKFVSHTKDGKAYAIDQALLEKTTRLLGIKGYCTSLPKEKLNDQGVIERYHDLWHVEQAFRMAKSDLAARPIYHHTQQSIHAHMAICFAALIIARSIEVATGTSLQRVIDALWAVTDATLVDTSTQERIVMRAPIPPETHDLINAIGTSY